MRILYHRRKSSKDARTLECSKWVKYNIHIHVVASGILSLVKRISLPIVNSTVGMNAILCHILDFLCKCKNIHLRSLMLCFQLLQNFHSETIWLICQNMCIFVTVWWNEYVCKYLNKDYWTNLQNLEIGIFIEFSTIFGKVVLFSKFYIYINMDECSVLHTNL